ncbi:HEAT repeat domain-containing protein [Glycomyces sp. NPDC046736]|uniref:HEAT repeat domain-containing protein n=1 Tax=Glycomyces sp. NPDC046736 TaxID=3155615 RepID=UPI003400FB68
MTQAHAIGALHARDASVRLKAALAVGTDPDPDAIDSLIERCATEPDFYVRDMLTWALTRLPKEITVPALLPELRSPRPQARSQALHTLSKIGEASAWPAITVELLRDEDREVARAAWRAAVALVPEDQETALAAELATQLGKGDMETQRSLSRALAALDAAAVPVLEAAKDNPETAPHAAATLLIIEDPDADFTSAIADAKRVWALGGAAA